MGATPLVNTTALSRIMRTTHQAASRKDKLGHSEQSLCHQKWPLQLGHCLVSPCWPPFGVTIKCRPGTEHLPHGEVKGRHSLLSAVLGRCRLVSRPRYTRWPRSVSMNSFSGPFRRKESLQLTHTMVKLLVTENGARY